MIIFPAVDIKDGRCVRLKQGLADQETVFYDNPLEAAEHWRSLGAQWLHVVDLDGAFSGEPKNYALIEAMCSASDIPVQLGGGVRDLQTAQRYIDAGVARLIIGTMALAEPDAFGEVCKALPGKVGVSLDAVDGRLKTKGWVEDSGLTVDNALPRLEEQGASFFVYTDISRDGMQSGVNVEALMRLCKATALPVIAAGGVTSMDDLKALKPLSDLGLEGVITGKAIYAGSLDFAEAVSWLQSE